MQKSAVTGDLAPGCRSARFCEKDLMENETDNFTDPVMNIGTVAEKLGISVSSIRRYEDEGLIIPHRTSSGRRLFSYEDLERIRVIRYMIKKLGLNVEGIRRLQALLPCWQLCPCSLEIKEFCSACKNEDKPCWVVKKTDKKIAKMCRECPVYRFGSQGVLDMKKLLYDVEGDEATGGIIEELIHRKANWEKGK